MGWQQAASQCVGQGRDQDYCDADANRDEDSDTHSDVNRDEYADDRPHGDTADRYADEDPDAGSGNVYTNPHADADSYTDTHARAHGLYVRVSDDNHRGRNIVGDSGVGPSDVVDPVRNQVGIDDVDYL